MPTSVPTPSTEPLPPLFGREKHLVGWQGMSLTTQVNWNPAKFSGNHDKGDMRLDDEDGVRLELRWEKPKKAANIEKSVTEFMTRLEKDAKKRRVDWENLEDAKLVSRSRKKKDQLTNFAWKSAGNPEASCGYGVAWSCPVCDRVVFGQILGRHAEKPQKVEKLASEVLTSMECHGEGGWETWSVFDLKVEVPKDFVSAKSQLLLNKLELEWIRPRPVGLYGWGRRPERIVARRFPIANVLLGKTSLENWAHGVLCVPHKQLGLQDPEPCQIRGHEGLLYRGPARDLRARLSVWFFDKLMRRTTPQGELRVWLCPESNKIWSLETELSAANAHVAQDVLDSIMCH